jgi:hypothetical protein
MIILGILFLAAAAVAAIELIVANDGATISLHMWRWTWHVEAFWLAVVGAAVLVVALLGLGMLKAGSGRARRLRRERRDLAKENSRLAERADVAESTQAAPVGADGYLRPENQSGAPTAETYPAQTGLGAPERQYDTAQHQASEPVERRG